MSDSDPTDLSFDDCDTTGEWKTRVESELREGRKSRRKIDRWDGALTFLTWAAGIGTTAAVAGVITGAILLIRIDERQRVSDERIARLGVLVDEDRAQISELKTFKAEINVERVGAQREHGEFRQRLDRLETTRRR